jgi:hypothetical protein
MDCVPFFFGSVYTNGAVLFCVAVVVPTVYVMFPIALDGMIVNVAVVLPDVAEHDEDRAQAAAFGVVVVADPVVQTSDRPLHEHDDAVVVALHAWSVAKGTQLYTYSH